MTSAFSLGFLCSQGPNEDSPTSNYRSRTTYLGVSYNDFRLGDVGAARSRGLNVRSPCSGYSYLNGASFRGLSTKRQLLRSMVILSLLHFFR